MEGEGYDAFFKELNPAYKPATSAAIGSELLSMNNPFALVFMLTELAEVFLESHQRMLSEFRPAVGKMIVLTCDGLTNVNHESVFNLMICSPFPFFFASFHLNGAEESAEQLLRQLRRAKSQLEVELVHNIGANGIRPPNNANNHNGDIVHPPNNTNNNAFLPPNNNAVRVANVNANNVDPILPNAMENWKMFFGLCTDNPNVMRKVRTTLMEQSKDTLWICYGCPCHALNSLMGDILKKRPFRRILQYDHLHFYYSQFSDCQSRLSRISAAATEHRII